ncbi:hypothetical protein NPIL_117761 [Nephila pilipes]|uniref:Uncharacterized protein n=1 Tax=Nephila pilipes TaxID=299642 RepID=A0A8X6PDH0_NEPPI|nr:hypothetical protein NPIL_117761 [Nephila pilipes]
MINYAFSAGHPIQGLQKRILFFVLFIFAGRGPFSSASREGLSLRDDSQFDACQVKNSKREDRLTFCFFPFLMGSSRRLCFYNWAAKQAICLEDMGRMMLGMAS